VIPPPLPKSEATNQRHEGIWRLPIHRPPQFDHAPTLGADAGSLGDIAFAVPTAEVMLEAIELHDATQLRPRKIDLHHEPAAAVMNTVLEDRCW
jgi:hypothetical protein